MTSSSKENVAFQLFNLKKLELKFARVRVFCLFLLPCKCILKEFSAFIFSSPFPASSLLFFFLPIGILIVYLAISKLGNLF